MFALRKQWKRLFALDLRGDWKVLLGAGTSFDRRALADYARAEGQGLSLWTEAGQGWRLAHKPGLSDLQALLRGLDPQAVYLTRFDEESPWSFVVYLDDHSQPPGYVFYRFNNSLMNRGCPI